LLAEIDLGGGERHYPGGENSGEFAVKRAAEIENEKNPGQSEHRGHGARGPIAVAEKINPAAEHQMVKRWMRRGGQPVPDVPPMGRVREICGRRRADDCVQRDIEDRISAPSRQVQRPIFIDPQIFFGNAIKAKKRPDAQ
jgi:hypothetical protein